MRRHPQVDAGVSSEIVRREFEKNGCELNVRVEGQFVFDDVRLVVTAATAGLGIAYLPKDHVKPLIAEGQLIRVLNDWCPGFPGLSPLLSRPPPALSRVHVGDRRAALSQAALDRCQT